MNNGGIYCERHDEPYCMSCGDAETISELRAHVSSLESKLAEAVRERDEHKQWRATLDEALAISANRSATLQSQRDEARSKLEQAERERDDAKANMFEADRQLNEVKRERDSLDASLVSCRDELAKSGDIVAQLNGQAAAMREALVRVKMFGGLPGSEAMYVDDALADDALAPDAGRALLAELAALREAVAKGARYRQVTSYPNLRDFDEALAALAACRKEDK